MADIADRSAVELAADVRARTLGVREVVAACLARIEQTNGVLNAVCTLNPAALAEAEAADRRLAAGKPARLRWVDGRPNGRTLHTLDSRLALAAQREGFLVPT